MKNIDDNESEQDFVEALHNAKTILGLTIVVIAHRLTTIQRADNIVCLDHDRGIVEQGRHDDLLQQNGVYKQFYTTQQMIKTVPISNQRLPKVVTENVENNIQQPKTLNDKNEKSTINNDNKMPMFLIEILKLNRSEWFYLCFGCLSSLIYGGVIPGFAPLFAEIFALFVEPDYQKQELQARNYSIIIFFIGVFGGICQMIFTSTFAKSAEELATKLRVMSFKTILSQEIVWFDRKENNIYTLINRLYTDINSLKGLSGTNIGIFCNAIGAFLTASVIAFRINPKLTLVILCFAPVVIFTNIVLQRLESFTNTRNTNGTKTKSNSHAEEGNKYASQAIENFRTVVSFCREEYFIEKYEHEFNSEFRLSIYRILFIALGNAIGNSLMFFIHATAFSYGSNLVKQNEISFVDVFRVFSVVTFAAMSIGRTIALVPSYSKAKQASQKIIQLNNQTNTTDRADSHEFIPSQLTGKIEFKNVWFKYIGEAFVLKNINVTCHENEMIALVGQSGSGKSTLISLFQRFYSPTVGQILLDGIDIKNLNIHWLRSKCSYVEQEPVLFNMSIKENICYGIEGDVFQEQIDEAARKANIYDRIQSLPDNYNTHCGNKEAQLLSIGEKQRIALARAFIRQPRILLLDEPTAALDAQSAKIVQNIINNLNPMPTCINVTHRLSTLDQNHSAAQIAVFQYGQICEQGTYSELTASEGRIFQQLVTLQQTSTGL